MEGAEWFPELSLEEAAFLAWNLWKVPHSGLGPLSLVDIITSRPGDPGNASVLDYPSNWGVNQPELVRKVNALTQDQQAELRRRFESLYELDQDTRGRLAGALKNWIQQRDDVPTRRWITNVLAQVGVVVSQQ